LVRRLGQEDEISRVAASVLLRAESGDDGVYSEDETVFSLGLV
jgi:hypothetical protein